MVKNEFLPILYYNGLYTTVHINLSGYMFGPTRVLLRVRASTHAHNSPAH